MNSLKIYLTIIAFKLLCISFTWVKLQNQLFLRISGVPEDISAFIENIRLIDREFSYLDTIFNRSQVEIQLLSLIQRKHLKCLESHARCNVKLYYCQWSANGLSIYVNTFQSFLSLTRHYHQLFKCTFTVETWNRGGGAVGYNQQCKGNGNWIGCGLCKERWALKDRSSETAFGILLDQ